jgi:hypothetical protein
MDKHINSYLFIYILNISVDSLVIFIMAIKYPKNNLTQAWYLLLRLRDSITQTWGDP